MNPLILGLIDVCIMISMFFTRIANCLIRTESKCYGTKIKRLVPLFDDEFRSIEVDYTDFFKRFWTMLLYSVFGQTPRGFEAVPMQGLYETFDGSLVLAKKTHPNASLISKSDKVFIATINDRVDMSRFVNSLYGSLNKQNDVRLCDLLTAFASSEAYDDSMLMRDLVLSLCQRSANLVITDVTSNDFNETVYGPDDVVVLDG